MPILIYVKVIKKKLFSFFVVVVTNFNNKYVSNLMMNRVFSFNVKDQNIKAHVCLSLIAYVFIFLFIYQYLFLY